MSVFLMLLYLDHFSFCSHLDRNVVSIDIDECVIRNEHSTNETTRSELNTLPVHMQHITQPNTLCINRAIFSSYSIYLSALVALDDNYYKL